MGGRKSTQAATTAAEVVTPADPVVTRMATEADPVVRAAGQRALDAARKRTGRTSTILTDALSRLTGSQGRLGA